MRLSELGDLGIDLRKLEDYCLDPSHPRGRHKARVFARALGIGRADARWLRDQLLAAGQAAQIEQIGTDRFGTRWCADITVARQDRVSVIRTLWMTRIGQPGVWLVTCWVF